MNHLLRILPLVAIAVLAWQQTQTRSQLREWQDQQATQVVQQPTLSTGTLSANSAASAEIAALRRELQHLQRQLQEIPVTPAQRPAELEDAIAVAADGKSESGSAGFTATIDHHLALGVLDQQAWEEMEADVASMSAEENRAFWSQVFAGIEQGQIQVIAPSR